MAEPVVETADGRFRGIVRDGVKTFPGIRTEPRRAGLTGSSPRSRPRLGPAYATPRSRRPSRPPL